MNPEQKAREQIDKLLRACGWEVRNYRVFLRSDRAQDYFKRVARGVAVKGVNIGDLLPCPILLPPPRNKSESWQKWSGG
jgi:hypothetical protein